MDDNCFDFLHSFFPFLPLKVIDLKTQLDNFKKVEELLRFKLGEAQGKRVIATAVYLFHIGVNDYQYPFSTNSSVFQSNPREIYVDFVVSNTTAVIKVNHIKIDVWILLWTRLIS